jgi:hypothetical protein
MEQWQGSWVWLSKEFHVISFKEFANQDCQSGLPRKLFENK